MFCFRFKLMDVDDYDTPLSIELTRAAMLFTSTF